MARKTKRSIVGPALVKAVVIAVCVAFVGRSVLYAHQTLDKSAVYGEIASEYLSLPSLSISSEMLSGGLGVSSISAAFGLNVSFPVATTPTNETEVPSSSMTTEAAEVSPTSTVVKHVYNRSQIVPFQKQEGVVIVTKIQGMPHWAAILQSFCLLHKAYNNRPLYDIVVFSSEPIDEAKVAEARALVAPAKFTLVVDNPGLKDMIRSFPPDHQEILLKRCGVKTVDEMDWYLNCAEERFKERLAYNWQAEFRALHIWTQPILDPYKYMVWIDTDVFCAQVWKQDPVAHAIQNDLALFFMNFPAGRTRGDAVFRRVEKAFNKTICGVRIANGHLATREGPCGPSGLQQVHGFFHISDLDFYRSERVMHWARTLIGDSHFYREYDDQIGITMPAAVYAPERSWHMTDHGFNLELFHNGKMDGKRYPGKHRYTAWWKVNGPAKFPEADGVCPITNGD